MPPTINGAYKPPKKKKKLANQGPAGLSTKPASAQAKADEASLNRAGATKKTKAMRDREITGRAHKHLR